LPPVDSALRRPLKPGRQICTENPFASKLGQPLEDDRRVNRFFEAINVTVIVVGATRHLGIFVASPCPAPFCAIFRRQDDSRQRPQTPRSARCTPGLRSSSAVGPQSRVKLGTRARQSHTPRLCPIIGRLAAVSRHSVNSRGPKRTRGVWLLSCRQEV